MQQAADRLRQAEGRQTKVEEREIAASELEGAIRATRVELSLREKALIVAENRVRTREQAATSLEERLRPTSSLARGGPLQATSTPAAAVSRLGVGGSEGQEWAADLQSLALVSSIPSASPTNSAGWDGHTRASERGGRGGASGVGMSGVHGGHPPDAETRERQLEAWSRALAEQAGAMREQALRLEVAYDQLRQREADAKRERESKSGGPVGEVGLRGTGKEDADDTVDNTEGFTRKQEGDRRGALSTAGASPTVVAAVPLSGTDAPAATSMSAAVGDGDASTSAEAAVTVRRQLEQETVRLAEKARELDAERRRLGEAAEAVHREQARALVERKEAADARRDAATLRIELERTRSRLDAEKGGLATERSLLAAERGRLATERARTRRADNVGGSADVQVWGKGEMEDPRDSVSATAPDVPKPMGTQRGDGGETGDGHAGETTPLATRAQADESERRATEDFERHTRAEVVASGSKRGDEPEGSVKPLARQLASELARETDPRASFTGRTGGGDGGSSQKVAASAALEEQPLQEPRSPAESWASSHRAWRPQQQRDNAEPGDERSGRRSTRKSVHGRRSESEHPKTERSTVESLRRRLHGVARRGKLGRGGGGGRGGDTSGESSPIVRPTRRKAAASSAGSSPLGPLPSSTFASSGDNPGQSRLSQGESMPPPLSPRAGLISSGQRLRGATTSAVSYSAVSRPTAAAAAAAVAAREDPFLAQLHARLAGADHTLRESLGRRQALLSRFGHDGSSVGPTSDTSDFPSASADASPEATVSSSSSPPDATSRQGTATAVPGGSSAAGVEARSSSTAGARSRFGFSGGVATPRRNVPGGGGHRGSPVATVVPPGSAASSSGAASALPGIREGGASADYERPAAGSVGGGEEEKSQWHRLAEEKAAPAGVTVATRGAGSSSSTAGARRRRGGSQSFALEVAAASDTDDTEAEKENLRELMRALGAAEVEIVEGDHGEDGASSDAEERERVDVQSAAEARPAPFTQHRGGSPTVGSRSAATGTENVGGTGVCESGESKGDRDDRHGGGGLPATGEADAGGGDTLMSSLRAQNDDISSRLQDMSLQVCRRSCCVHLGVSRRSNGLGAVSYAYLVHARLD